MTYRQSKKKSQKYFKIIFSIILILVIFTPLKIFLGKISNIFFIKAFVAKAEISEIISNTEMLLTPKNKLIEKIKSQQKEIEKLKITEISYNELLLNYSNLEKLLSVKENYPNFIFSQVRSSPKQSIYDTIILNDSFKVGSLVISESGNPIGKIESSNKNSSSVLLFSHAGLETEGFLQDEATPVTLVGKGAGNFLISLPREIKISEGDKIYIYGVKNSIGKVGLVEFDARDPFQKVFVISYENIFKIKNVLVEEKL